MNVIALFLLMFADAQTEGPKENRYKVLLENAEKAKPEKIKKINTELKALDPKLTKLVNARVERNIGGTQDNGKSIIFPTPELKKEAIAEVKTEIDKLKKLKKEIENGDNLEIIFWAALGSPPFAVGQIGRYDGAPIYQIIDKTSMILTCSTLNYIDAKGFPHSSNTNVLVRHTDTTGLADGQGYDIKTLWEISGTENFRGTTYLVAEPITVDEIKKRAKQGIKPELNAIPGMKADNKKFLEKPVYSN